MSVVRSFKTVGCLNSRNVWLAYWVRILSRHLSVAQAHGLDKLELGKARITLRRGNWHNGCTYRLDAVYWPAKFYKNFRGCVSRSAAERPNHSPPPYGVAAYCRSPSFYADTVNLERASSRQPCRSKRITQPNIVIPRTIDVPTYLPNAQHFIGRGT
jgi:hypothetical protein